MRYINLRLTYLLTICVSNVKLTSQRRERRGFMERKSFFSKRTTFNTWPCLYADVIQCVSLAIHYSLRFVVFYTVFLRRPVEKLGAINILRFITWSPKFAAGGGGGVAVRRNSLDTPTSSHVDNSKINNSIIYYVNADALTFSSIDHIDLVIDRCHDSFAL